MNPSLVTVAGICLSRSMRDPRHSGHLFARRLERSDDPEVEVLRRELPALV